MFFTTFYKYLYFFIKNYDRGEKNNKKGVAFY